MENENDVLKIYREYMAAELSRPEIRAEKEKLAAYFSAPAAAPVFSFASLGFFIPAFVIAGIFLFLFNIQSRTHLVQGPSTPIYRMFAAFMEESRAREAAQKALQVKPSVSAMRSGPRSIFLEDPVRNHMKPRVVVKRISSRVGPTLVYQKVYRKTPVTIVWVFTPGGPS